MLVFPGESGRHSREFMLNAVERLEAGEPAGALAIKLNLNRTIIRHWRDRFRAGGVEAPASQRGHPRTPEVLLAESVRVEISVFGGLCWPAQWVERLRRLAACHVTHRPGTYGKKPWRQV